MILNHLEIKIGSIALGCDGSGFIFDCKVSNIAIYLAFIRLDEILGSVIKFIGSRCIGLIDQTQTLFIFVLLNIFRIFLI